MKRFDKWRISQTALGGNGEGKILSLSLYSYYSIYGWGYIYIDIYI